MEIRVVSGDITALEVDAVVVNLFEGVKEPGGATGAVDRALDGAISALIADGELKGKTGASTLIHTLGKMRPKRVLVTGLGKRDKFTLDTVRRVSAESSRYLRGLGIKRAATIVHGAGIGGLAPRAAAQALTEGALLGLYRFQQYKGKPDANGSKLEELLVVEREAGQGRRAARGGGAGTHPGGGGGPGAGHGERASQWDDADAAGRDGGGGGPGA